jgi:hypothetical protein
LYENQWGFRMAERDSEMVHFLVDNHRCNSMDFAHSAGRRVFPGVFRQGCNPNLFASGILFFDSLESSWQPAIPSGRLGVMDAEQLLWLDDPVFAAHGYSFWDGMDDGKNIRKESGVTR